MYVAGRQRPSASVVLNGHLGALVGFYDLTGNHKLDETHTERDFCLETITINFSDFHLKLTSAAKN